MAAASTVMDRVLRAVLVEEVKDIFKEERVEMVRVGLEVAVVYAAMRVQLEATVEELEAVEVTLEEMVELKKKFSCGGGGGSFNNGTIQHNECCFNSYEHGRVIITFLQ